MRQIIFDIETDGLLENVTKLYCFSYHIYENGKLIEKKTLKDYKEIEDFIKRENIFIGHNIVRYDIPILEKLLNIKFSNKLIIDTLSLSWYLNPIKNFKHNLEIWGERLGISKIEIEDWANLEIKDYILRCEKDVEITSLLFFTQLEFLVPLYGDYKKLSRLFSYLSFKMDCLREHEENGLYLNVHLIEKHLEEISKEIEEKKQILISKMPKVEKIKNSTKKENVLTIFSEETLEEKSYIEPNPNSSLQVKKWLFSLGWEPKTFKVSRKGERIPQISLPFGQGLCPSVLSLEKEHPYLVNLRDFYRYNHRKSLLEALLEKKDENNFVYCKARGLANTLRLQHMIPLANLPSLSSYYGKELRETLTIPNENYIMCGSDLSALEDNTKLHYMFYFDKEYVKQIKSKDFDAHLDIGVLSNLITEEQRDFYKNFNSETANEEEKKEYKEIKKMRDFAKIVNFSATYGAGVKKIAETLECPFEFAEKLFNTYWSRNKAIKEIAKNVETKEIFSNFNRNVQLWLYNPVSKLWTFLREEKNKFSTLNQHTGVFVFDTWLKYIRFLLKPYNIKISHQYHDEILIICEKKDQQIVNELLKKAIDKTNKELGLNVYIPCSIYWGKNYAECH